MQFHALSHEGHNLEKGSDREEVHMLQICTYRLAVCMKDLSGGARKTLAFTYVQSQMFSVLYIQQMLACRASFMFQRRSQSNGIRGVAADPIVAPTHLRIRNVLPGVSERQQEEEQQHAGHRRRMLSGKPR